VSLIAFPDAIRHPTSQTRDSSRCFDEVILAIKRTTEELGGETRQESVLPWNSWDVTCRNMPSNTVKVLLGFNLLSVLPEYAAFPPVPSEYIVYNMEQVGATKWFQGTKGADILKSHRVWDYSPRNIAMLREMHVHAYHMPVGFVPELGPSDQLAIAPPEQDIDVLLVGQCIAARCDVIRACAALGLTARIAGGSSLATCGACKQYQLPPAYGAERLQLLRRAKVLLNVHYFEKTGVFEIVRVSYYLANSFFVISERGKDPALEQPWERGVVFASSRAVIPELTLEYVRNATARRGVAARGLAAVRSQRIDHALRCEVFQGGSIDHPGHVVSLGGNESQVRTFTRVFAGELRFTPPVAFQVLAIMSGFNEADVLESSIMHYLQEGCSVHYVDNWSTDSTAKIIKRIQRKLRDGSTRVPRGIGLTLTSEMFPAVDTHTYDWAVILRRKAQIAKDSPHNWIIHADADEIRESAWGSEVPIRQGLYVAQMLGYNSVNFGVLLVFHPVKGEACVDHTPCDMKGTYQYWDRQFVPGDTSQLKAWRNYNRHDVDTNEVDLSSSGGHMLQFVSGVIEQKIFPWYFVLRHYPIRSQEHGVRKVFLERKNRWNPEEHGKREWHVQYDAITSKTHNFVVNKRNLKYAPGGKIKLYDGVYSLKQPCMEMLHPKDHHIPPGHLA
jgi:hypothetical protein